MKKRNKAVAAIIAPVVAVGALLGRRRMNRRKERNVYFISGMCYNCTVFDALKLPEGFVRQYIEWHVPRADETLREYALNMASKIDTSRPFVLIGYSFGAVVMQEMCRFVKPEKCVVISSFKHKDEVPPLFRVVKRVNLLEKIPSEIFEATEFVTEAFNRFVYHTTNEKLSHFMTHTDPVYIRWSVERITEWVPDNCAPRLFHIHGTEDQIFPFKHIINPLPVDGGDHLMVWRKADVVSALLCSVLLIDGDKKQKRV